MRVIQATFGVFHHFELARELLRRGHLQRIYSSWPWRRLKREGCPRELVRIYPWVHTPEMLLRRTGFPIKRILDQIGYLNAITMDRFVTQQLRYETTPDALISLSGSSLHSGMLVQRQGGRFICDRGSSHQRVQEKLVREEYRRWGVLRPVTDPRVIDREERIYDQADCITVPSTFAASSFSEMGIPPAKVRVIPYGVRLENFRPTSTPPANAFQVLFAGSVGLRKGFPYLLQAFHAISHPHKKLIVAGSVQPDIKSVLATLPQEQVEFVGSVPQARLAELMSSSHVMVLPSIEEGLALVQGQALACGCPVLATSHTGAEDLFTDGVEGFIVPIRSVQALQHRMQELAEDNKLQQRMRAAALTRVHALGGWKEYGDKWESLLHELTGVA